MSTFDDFMIEQAVKRDREAESMQTSLRVLRSLKTRLNSEIARLEALHEGHSAEETRLVINACLTSLKRVRGEASA